MPSRPDRPAEPETGMFGRLRAACADDWAAYTGHRFVRQIADGSLPEACFRHYLVQDYLFLIQFARAYGLAAYKSDRLEDIRAASRAISAIVDTETSLHIEFCRGWGLSEAELETAPEARATLAYTRYVLERGAAGDLLDLHVALAPCVVGYAEIAAGIAANSSVTENNPYGAWIDMYAGDDYQSVARAEIDLLDRLSARRGGNDRFDDLARNFSQAVRLEAEFWEMAITLAD
jgi:thiaminase (transcriptional activator TenA)